MFLEIRGEFVSLELQRLFSRLQLLRKPAASTMVSARRPAPGKQRPIRRRCGCQPRHRSCLFGLLSPVVVSVPSSPWTRVGRRPRLRGSLLVWCSIRVVSKSWAAGNGSRCSSMQGPASTKLGPSWSVTHRRTCRDERGESSRPRRSRRELIGGGVLAGGMSLCAIPRRRGSGIMRGRGRLATGDDVPHGPTWTAGRGQSVCARPGSSCLCLSLIEAVGRGRESASGSKLSCTGIGVQAGRRRPRVGVGAARIDGTDERVWKRYKGWRTAAMSLPSMCSFALNEPLSPTHPATMHHSRRPVACQELLKHGFSWSAEECSVHHDVDETFRMLMKQMEGELSRGSVNSRLVPALFEGRQVWEVRSPHATFFSSFFFLFLVSDGSPPGAIDSAGRCKRAALSHVPWCVVSIPARRVLDSIILPGLGDAPSRLTWPRGIGAEGAATRSTPGSPTPPCLKASLGVATLVVVLRRRTTRYSPSSTSTEQTHAGYHGRYRLYSRIPQQGEIHTLLRR